MLQFRPGGPLYDEDALGWVFRDGERHICSAREVRVGDVLPSADVFDESDPSIRTLIPVTQIRQVPPIS